MSNARKPQVRAAVKGSTLIEVLISVLVMSIGMLGIAGLQAFSLSNNHAAGMRNAAVELARDMGDRMRSNRTAVSAAAPNNYASVVPAKNDCRAVYVAAVVATPVACNPTALAADDLWDWMGRVALQLPAGEGEVCRDSTPNDGVVGAHACDGIGTVYAVKLFWTEKASGTANVEAKRLAMVMRP